MRIRTASTPEIWSSWTLVTTPSIKRKLFEELFTRNDLDAHLFIKLHRNCQIEEKDLGLIKVRGVCEFGILEDQRNFFQLICPRHDSTSNKYYNAEYRAWIKDIQNRQK